MHDAVPFRRTTVRHHHPRVGGHIEQASDAESDALDRHPRPLRGLCFVGGLLRRLLWIDRRARRQRSHRTDGASPRSSPTRQRPPRERRPGREQGTHTTCTSDNGVAGSSAPTQRTVTRPGSSRKTNPNSSGCPRPTMIVSSSGVVWLSSMTRSSVILATSSRANSSSASFTASLIRGRC